MTGQKVEAALVSKWKTESTFLSFYVQISHDALIGSCDTAQ